MNNLSENEYNVQEVNKSSSHLEQAPSIASNVTLFPYDWYWSDVEIDGKLKTRIEIYCLNKESEDCCVVINDYDPYCYIELPSSIRWTTKQLSDIMTVLSEKNKYSNYTYVNGKVGGFTSVKRNALHGYLKGQLQGGYRYLKCRFGSNSAMMDAKRNIEKKAIAFGTHSLNLTVHETNIDPIHKLTVEKDLKYSSWFTTKVCEITEEDEKISRFTHEYVASWNDLAPADPHLTKDWNVSPRICSFDIEANSENKLRFPNENKYECDAFAMSVNYQQYGKPETRKKYSIIYGDCKAPEGIEKAFYVNNQFDLIEIFVDLMIELNADILIGYNIFGFDYRYLNGRLRLLWEEWPERASRIKGRKPQFKDESWQSSNTNKVNLEYVDFPGRISSDAYGIIKTMIRLPSYKLEAVSQEYLNRGKHDVSPKEMFEAYDEYLLSKKVLERCTAYIVDNKPIRHANVTREAWRAVIRRYTKALESMCKIMEYCNEDSALVIDLFEKLKVWETLMQFSNVLQVCMKYVYTKGQQFKGIAQLYTLLAKKGVVFNGSSVEVRKEKYEGALNLGTKFKMKGFYIKAISLDVNSMYPSIILFYNLCVSTEITKNDTTLKEYIDNYINHTWTDYEDSNKGDKFTYDLYFVKQNVHKGFFPQLVDDLLKNRRAVKAEMELTDPKSSKYTILNATQEALKVSANSLYGMLGTSKNPKIPSKHIAALVTKIGRDTLMKIVGFIRNGGPPGDSESKNLSKPLFKPGTVIYGDTDSVQFVVEENFTTKEEWIAFGEYYTKCINDYIAPLRVAFEKFGDILLVGPKMYVFRMVDTARLKPDKSINPKFGSWGKHKYTGIGVKRDQAQIQKSLIKQVCELIMLDTYRLDLNEKERSITRLQDIIDLVIFGVAKTLKEKYPREHYYISQAYNKESKTSPMSALANRMARIGKPINVGERVNYIFVSYPGERSNPKVGLKMRLPDDIGEMENLDTYFYAKRLQTSIDGILCACYDGNSTYKDFLEKKDLVRRMFNVIKDKNLFKLDYDIVKSENVDLDNLMITMIKENINQAIAKNNAKNNKAKRKTKKETEREDAKSDTDDSEENDENEEREDANEDDEDAPTAKITIPLSKLEMPESYNDLVVWRASDEYKNNVPRNHKSAITNAIKKVHNSGLFLLTRSPCLIEKLLFAYNMDILDKYAEIMMSPDAYKEMMATLMS